VRGSTIAGIGHYVPERVMKNAELEQYVDTTDEWIVTRTGIRERRIAAPEQASSDLGLEAAKEAMAHAGVTPDDIDLIIVGTATPDMLFPATACILQDRLGARKAGAFDLSAACSSWVYGIAVAHGYVSSGLANTVLVVGAETLSKITNWKDRGTCVLFGDGAGAVVLRPSDAPGLIGSVLGTDGTAAEILIIPAGGSARPATPESVAGREHTIRMPSGRDVFKRAVKEMASACRELLDKSGYEPGDVDLLIPHQANSRIMVAVAERMGIGLDRAVVDVAEIGNTSAASIPIALDRAWRAGRIAPDALVLMTSFGAGLAWGANLLRWTAPAPVS